MAARSQGEKYLSKTSAESLVQIQNNFTEMFLIMPSAKIAHHSALLNKMAARAKNRNIFKLHF